MHSPVEKLKIANVSLDSVTTRKHCEMLTVQRGEHNYGGKVDCCWLYNTVENIKMYVSFNYQKLNALLKCGRSSLDERD